MFDAVNEDMKKAMKAKNKEKTQALRYLKSILMENKTAKKPIAELDVVVKHHKRLKDSLESFPEGHRMREQTLKEMEFISVYLPKPLTEGEVQELIEQIKAKLEKPNMGAVMKELQPQIKGKFDGKKAFEMVKDSLT